jgi:hypothetical protein
MEITVDRVNRKTIDTQNGSYVKYGIQTDTGGDRWIDIVDWDRVYDNDPINTGDTVAITEPERGDYGWQAKFIEPTGFSDSEQILHILQEQVKPMLRELNDKLEGKVSEQPNPSANSEFEAINTDNNDVDVDAAFNEYEEATDSEDINW